jgi:hypothetical protein
MSNDPLEAEVVQDNSPGQADSHSEYAHGMESGVDRDSAEVVKNIHSMYSDALKIVGAGNAAGAAAAGAALHNFANLHGLIKFGGICFLLGVVCFAVGIFFLFAMTFAGTRIVGAARRGKTKEFINEQAAFATDCIRPLVYAAFIGAALFFGV